MVVIAELSRGETPPEVVREIVRRLERGEVLLLPTDTVYGLHAHTRYPQAIKRIKEIKRIEDKGARPFATLYSTVLDVGRWVLLPEGSEKRKVLDSWPGPVTWVLPARRTVPRELLGKDKTLGIRIPSHPLLRAVCTALDNLVVSTSANFHGEEPPIKKEQIPEELLNEVDGVVYNKEVLGGRPSEVKRWTPTGPVVLRSRQKDKLGRQEKLNILIVCSGNICRSPMAQGLLQDRINREDSGKISVKSAGIIALHGNRASLPATTTMKEHGLDISTHRSRPVSEDILRWADIVLTMTNDHLGALHDKFPEFSEKFYLYSAFPEGVPEDCEDVERYDVPDPYGLSIDDYRDTYARLNMETDRIFPHILKRVL